MNKLHRIFILIPMFFLLVGCNSLSEKYKDSSKKIPQQISDATALLEKQSKHFNLLKKSKDWSFLKEYASDWDKNFSDSKSELNNAITIYNEKIVPIVKKDKSSDSNLLVREMLRATNSIASSKKLSLNVSVQSKKLLDAKKNAPKLVKVSEEKVRRIEQIMKNATQATDNALKFCPAEKNRIQQSHTQFSSIASQVESAYENIKAESKNHESGLKTDYSKLVTSSQKISSILQSLNKQAPGFIQKQNQLNTSYDKVLVNYKEEGGMFFHKYEIIVNGKVQKPNWAPVNETFYLKHEKNISMVIESKSYCQYESDRSKEVLPPGMNHIAKAVIVDGKPTGSNQYGEWQTNSSGNSFFHYYGMYSMFSNMLGSNNYSYNDYDRYNRRDRRTGSYYGRGEYGSNGSRTYSSGSRYKRSEQARRTRSVRKTRTASVKRKQKMASRKSSSGSVRSSGYSSRSRGSGSRGK